MSNGHDVDNLKRDQLIEQTEYLLLEKVESVIEIAARLGVAYNTAKDYKKIARDRLDKAAEKAIDLTTILKNELKEIEYIEKKAWESYVIAKSGNERTGAMNTIVKCKERRAKLLGLDTENINEGKSKSLEQLLDESNARLTASNPDALVAVDSQQAEISAAISPEQRTNGPVPPDDGGQTNENTNPQG